VYLWDVRLSRGDNNSDMDVEFLKQLINN